MRHVKQIKKGMQYYIDEWALFVMTKQGKLATQDSVRSIPYFVGKLRLIP